MFHLHRYGRDLLPNTLGLYFGKKLKWLVVLFSGCLWVAYDGQEVVGSGARKVQSGIFLALDCGSKVGSLMERLILSIYRDKL